MQEEQGEVAVPAWLCPLCQKGQTDRDSLALHLTNGHSVLPACLDRLLNTAIPVPEGDARQDTDSTQQMHPEISGAQSNPSETTENSSCPLPARSPEDKVVSQPEHTVREEAESDHGIEESSNTQKESCKTSKPVDKAIGRNSKLTRNLALEKFLDLARPFKCIVCLESFSSKSSLSVHYSSPAHLHRMRMGSSKQVTENDSNQSRPYIPSKPYKCSVCRVSYNHAITLDSHLKSVLHQTRSRNAGNATSSTEENSESKSKNHSGNEATDSSGNSVAQSVGVATSEGASLSASTVTTKDGDKITSQLALSMHSSPVASAQAVSAFLTLLTSGSPSPSLTHSLFMGHAGSAHQLLPQQQQLLLPLFLNGLQGQSLSPNQESIGPVLAQSVPVMSLGSAQQALLAQRLGGLQSAAEIPRKVCWAEDKVSAGETMEGVEKVKAIVQEEDDEEEDDEECSRMKANTEKVLLKHVVKVEEDITERDIKKEIELNISLRSRKENEIVDDNTDENEEGEKKYEIDIDNMTEQSNCGKQLKLKEHVKEETEVSCDIVKPNLTKLKSDLNAIPSDHSPLPCSLSPSCRTSLSPMNFNLTLSPDPTPQNSFTDTISRPSLNPIPALDSRLSRGCINNELSSHVTQTTAININPAVDPQDPRRTSAILKPYDSEQCPPILSEFQFQVLWAFLESRCEVDVNSPLREDCEALGREVGLSEEEVRRWLRNARVSKENQKEGGTECVGCEEVQKERLSESAGVDGILDKEDEKEVGVLTIVEGRVSPVSSGLVMDLSNRGGRARKEEQGRASQGGSCLTSDSEAEEFYTSVILTEEDSQSDSMQEELSSPAKEAELGDKAEYVTGGGKVLRSSTVFLSDAEYEEAGEDGIAKKAKRIKRKKVTDGEQVKVKRMRRNPEVDQPLEAQTVSLASTKREGLPRISTSGVLHSLPISLSLAPFASQFLSPYVLSLPPSSVGLSIADRGEDQDRGNVPIFSNPPTVTRCPDPFNVPPPSSHTPLPQSLPNGGDCESALDLSIGKSYGSAPAQSSSASTNDRTLAQRDKLLDGLGLRPTSIGVPGTGGLLVVQVKPDSTIGIPTPSRNDFSIHSNKGKISNMPIKAAEVSTTVREREKDRKNPKVRRYRDMRRSRTVIHSDQLDVLYGCYFKDPNPGKHEFEQISEWIHLPKKVVQIWFQNMRARERKGEVRFISDGTLAAVGKPLIKFTWPLTQPIFSSGSKPNSISPHSSGVTAKPNPLDTCPKIKPEQELKKQKEAPALSKFAASRSVPNTGISAPSVPKAKIESDAPAALTQTIPKVSAVISTLPAVKTPVKRKRGKEHEIKKEEEENTDDEEEQESNNFGPGTTNRMVPKLPFKHLGKHSVPESQKNNRLNYWSPQGPFKINTLCRDQLGLSTTSPLKDTSTTPSVASKSPPAEGAYLQQSTPRRPRTLLTSLQLSILQSCYETCAHPNALECEAVGTELGLPLKVVQIWFQNTRAKEKRWRLQQEKQSPSSTDSPKKVDVSSGSYLHYSALRANRPILPKPVKLTVVEPSTPPVLGQPAGRETLRGRCEVCAVCFESRAAGRAHVFSIQHLATLRVTNFGQLPSLVNNGSNAWSSSDSGVATSSSPSLTNTSS